MREVDLDLPVCLNMVRTASELKVCQGEGYLFDAILTPGVSGEYPVVRVYDGVDAVGGKRLIDLRSEGRIYQRKFRTPLVFHRGLFIDVVYGVNLLADGSTENLEHAAWTATDVTVDSATLMTFDAQLGKVYQIVNTADGAYYTLSFSARWISGNTDLRFYHSPSETGATTGFTITDVLTQYSVTVLGRSGGGEVWFGVRDNNAAGHGQVEISKWQVEAREHMSIYSGRWDGSVVLRYLLKP